MFGMGWQEILMILVIAVLVIGPEQLPQVARTIGKMVAQFRRATNDLRDSLHREFNEKDEFKDFKEFQQSVDSELRGISLNAQDYVEREVAKEEAELKRLEEEVTAATDPGPLKSPGTEAPESQPWVSSAGDLPTEDPPAAESGAEGKDDATVERSSSRKETA